MQFMVTSVLLRNSVAIGVIAAVCYFGVYKLIGLDPANIYMFKVNCRALEKGVNFVQS